MTIVVTESVRSNTGYPWPGGAQFSIDSSTVKRLGKLTTYGDARTLFLLELADGRIVHVKACDQDKPVEKWLRKLAKTVRAHWASREVGWSSAWSEPLF